jgi:hypothetical protein
VARLFPLTLLGVQLVPLHRDYFPLTPNAILVVASEQRAARHSEPIGPLHSSVPEPIVGLTWLSYPPDRQTLLFHGHRLDPD